MSNLPVVEKSKGSFKQLIRYTLVGIVSNLFGYLVYLLVTYFGSTPKITMTLLYGVGAAIGYLGNRNFTFSYKGSMLSSSIKYFIVHLFGYFINLAILIVYVDQLGYAHQWVQAIAIFGVAGFLFLAFKYFVFTDPNASNVDEL